MTVIQDEGNERSLEWSLNDDGTLDLFVETRKGQQKERGNSPMMKQKPNFQEIWDPNQDLSKRTGLEMWRKPNYTQ
jgi:hypothetical protein